MFIFNKTKQSTYMFSPIQLMIPAGRQTTNEELEEMLEQGNPAVFTQGVSSLFCSPKCFPFQPNTHLRNTTQAYLFCTVCCIFGSISSCYR